MKLLQQYLELKHEVEASTEIEEVVSYWNGRYRQFYKDLQTERGLKPYSWPQEWPSCLRLAYQKDFIIKFDDTCEGFAGVIEFTLRSTHQDPDYWNIHIPIDPDKREEYFDRATASTLEGIKAKEAINKANTEKFEKEQYENLKKKFDKPSQ